MLRILILLLLAAIGLQGCASMFTLEPAPEYGVRLSEVDWSLQELQRLVAYELPVGLRTTSPNGREFGSRYYIVERSNYKPAGEALDRYTAHVTILGAERPYQVEITVDHERRILYQSGYDYKVVGHDKALAEQLAFKLREQLTKRREDRNIIDDFRVF